MDTQPVFEVPRKRRFQSSRRRPKRWLCWVALSIVVALPIVVVVAAFHFDLGHGAFGYAEGKYETLEDDLDAQHRTLTSLLDDALGDYEELGSSVGISLCTPLNEWGAVTSIVVNPEGVTPTDGVSRIIDLLESLGLEPELSITDVRVDLDGLEEPLRFYYSEVRVDLDGFGEPLRFYSSDRPQPGIVVTLGGDCYPKRRITTDSPFSLEYEQGLSRLQQDSYDG